MMFVVCFLLVVAVSFVALRRPPECKNMTEEEYIEYFKKKIMGMK